MLFLEDSAHLLAHSDLSSPPPESVGFIFVLTSGLLLWAWVIGCASVLVLSWAVYSLRDRMPSAGIKERMREAEVDLGREVENEGEQRGRK